LGTSGETAATEASDAASRNPQTANEPMARVNRPKQKTLFVELIAVSFQIGRRTAQSNNAWENACCE
jgi:hypothetical protein